MILKPSVEVLFGTKLKDIRNQLLHEFECLATSAAENGEPEFVLRLKYEDSRFESFIVGSALTAKYILHGCHQSGTESDLYLYFSFAH